MLGNEPFDTGYKLSDGLIDTWTHGSVTDTN